jgi:hypothetical protein
LALTIPGMDEKLLEQAIGWGHRAAFGSAGQ